MLDLGQPRSLPTLLAVCGDLYQRRFRLFAGIALMVVVPLDLITLGVIDGYLTSGFDAADDLGWNFDLENDEDGGGGTSGIAYGIVSLLVTTPLVTAGHVIAVTDLGAGREPSARRSLEEAGPVLAKVIGTLLLVILCVGIGLIALIIPGIYLYVRFFVAAQAVVAEGLGPTSAMRRSGELVQGIWWRVFGIVIVLALIAALVSSVVSIPLALAASAADAGAIYVLGQIIADTVGITFTALSGTLLFFDLRARKSGAVAVAEPAPPPDDKASAPDPERRPDE